MALHTSPRSKYDPLNRYLARLPRSHATVTLTVAQLEGILGPCHQADPLGVPAWDLARIQQAFLGHATFTVAYDRRQKTLVWTRRVQPSTSRQPAHTPAGARW